MIDAIARAVLYEGYLLYPYRGDALKNRKRFAFGVLYPPSFADANPPDASTMHVEVLATRPSVTATVGFLELTDEGAREHAIPIEPGSLCTIRLDALGGDARCDVTKLDEDLFRITIVIRNTTPFLLGRAAPRAPGALPLDPRTTFDGDREAAMGRSFVSTHVRMTLSEGSFISLANPPLDVEDLAMNCKNEGAWPVLIDDRSMLASPIILEDRPRIAPESPGDLFDATEIDEILTLRILTLTDAEKAELRKDPRAREILERTEALGPEAILRLHGRAPFSRGMRVRLRPHGRTDVFDLALDGKLATIEAVEKDLEGKTLVAVTLDDDPGRDLGAFAHRFFFRPDEMELV